MPRLTNKIEPTKRHTIVKNYLALWSSSSPFSSVTDLASTFRIGRNLPCKLKNRFDQLRKEIHPSQPIDYTKNIFLEREKLRKHRKLPHIKQYKKFVKSYPRWWYQSYDARCTQKWNKPL